MHTRVLDLEISKIEVFAWVFGQLRISRSEVFAFWGQFGFLSLFFSSFFSAVVSFSQRNSVLRGASVLSMSASALRDRVESCSSLSLSPSPSVSLYVPLPLSCGNQEYGVVFICNTTGCCFLFPTAVPRDDTAFGRRPANAEGREQRRGPMAEPA